METAPPAMAAMKEALLEAIRPYCPPEGGRRRASPASHGRAASAQGRPAGRSATSAGLARGQWRRIGREVLTLHEAYTTGGRAFTHESNPIHGNMAGYQFYFLPRNVMRVHTVLAGLPWQQARAGGGAGAPGLLAPWCRPAGGEGVLRVLDLGCGTGAFSLAVLSWLAGLAQHGERLPALHLRLVDQGHGLLRLAEANLRAFAARGLPGLVLQIETRADGVERALAEAGAEPPFALAGAAMMLGELGLLGPRRASERAVRFAESLRRLVAPGGAMVLVEPGTRKGYMNLMAVRAHLVPLPILYPCPHGDACPLWQPRVGQWCHATRPLPPGFFFDEELRRYCRLAFEMRELNLAGLAVQVSDRAVRLPPFEGAPGSRIVSAPMGGRGPRGAPAPAPIVLECARDGRLHERPAAGLGRYTRGLWLQTAADRG